MVVVRMKRSGRSSSRDAGRCVPALNSHVTLLMGAAVVPGDFELALLAVGNDVDGTLLKIFLVYSKCKL